MHQRRGLSLNPLQELCRHGDGNDLGLLARDARHADRAGDAGQHVGRDAALLVAMQEARALGPRADQAEVAQIARGQPRQEGMTEPSGVYPPPRSTMNRDAGR